jgi:hypothetical protein
VVRGLPATAISACSISSLTGRIVAVTARPPSDATPRRIPVRPEF